MYGSKESPLSRESVYPLTHPQRRIWVIEQIFPGMPLHNIGGPVRMKGSIDLDVLEASILAFIRRHDALRIRIGEADGQPYQTFGDAEPLMIGRRDFSGSPDPEGAFRRWVDEQAGKPFRLSDESPLYEFTLYRIGEDDSGYLFRCHHIIADGWSNAILTKQIADDYALLAAGGPIPEGEGASSYVDYIRQEQHYLNSPRMARNKRFWNEKFALHSAPGNTGYRYAPTDGRRMTVDFQPDLALLMKTFAAQANASLNAYFVMLYALYLYRTTGQTAITIGTPVANRSGKQEKSIFGMFTSTMPLRLQIDETAKPSELLADIQRELTACYYHQRYPYDLLLRDLDDAHGGGGQLFDTCINYYNTKLASSINHASIENVEFYSGHQWYALQLVIKEWSEDGGLTLDADYKLSEHDEDGIRRMLALIRTINEHILTGAKTAVSQLELLTEEERNRQLIAFNDTAVDYPRDRTVCDLFAEEAERGPHRIALQDGEAAMTYRELDDRSGRLAGVLIGKGVRRESIVGLLVRHSAEAVVAILAVMKTGGAYLPIDPDYPFDRIGYMLGDSGAALLLTDDGTHAAAARYGTQRINLQDPGLYEDSREAALALPSAKPDQLAYVIYTSGSTGRPKGAMIEHRGLTNYIWWAKQMYTRGRGEVFPLYTSLAFDLTVTSIFTPLVSGGTIRVYRSDDGEFSLFRILRDNEATVVKLTPAHLSLLKDTDYRDSSVKTFIVGGEDLKTSLAQAITNRFGGEIDIYNEYGPTETVVGCMIHKFDPDEDGRASVPIGVPGHNVQLYVLDERMRPVPPGMLGELFVSGDGVARGYLNREELTRERFADNPFKSGARMYRTGDLARFLPSGKLEYGGRIDHQVKIRGHRVELPEVEACLMNMNGMRECVVIDLEQEGQGRYLCAYYVADRTWTDRELASQMSNTLPDYMVPTSYVRLDHIPLNVNGKVDRPRLPEPERRSVKGDYNAPDTRAEKLLAHTLESVLGFSPIGMGDNFYHLGGDSIKAIQTASRLSQAGGSIKVKDMLANPIIGDMARAVQIRAERDARRNEPGTGELAPTPILAWFMNRELAQPHHDHQSVLLRLKQPLSNREIGLIMRALIGHHDALRLNLRRGTRTWHYTDRAESDSGFAVKGYDLSSLSGQERQDKLAELGERFKSEFDLYEGLLFKACLFDLGEDGPHLLLAAHHAVVDGVSWRILLEDFALAAEAVRQGKEILFPPTTDSYQRHALRLMEQTEADEAELAYWRKATDLATAWPEDRDFGEDVWGSSHTETIRLSETDTNALVGGANLAYGTQPIELMAAALAEALGAAFPATEPVVELEGHGRLDAGEDADVGRTVGWFTTLYPVLLPRGGDIAARIKAAKETLRRVPRGGIGFGVLAEHRNAFPAYRGLKPVRFNYLGEFGRELDNEWFAYSDLPTGAESGPANALSFRLEWNAMIIGGRLQVGITYSRNLYADETIERLAAHYADALRTILRHCADKEESEFTPSDFETAALSQADLDHLFR
ncbi:non-ribosomal peptide synthetase [Paenibacillus methanolicus]|uniref:Non-ribosomal peptide synthase protein (TIGR01720 family)/amino acid adenylation domain-containing protein n=1 Tax=Paenibacillus methanolicus TaxID=582686 RepID=A0A5S5BYZ5_9BACL|nr:non-ribosomal peptide synthetase [Paenibacillus methanolicus]TYP72401.1 non-ribosomal peptide synthase protein (TIGR01720 family)/amino acid adenylation domain-containing protein [Paenibacillus methanolicus]